MNFSFASKVKTNIDKIIQFVHEFCGQINNFDAEGMSKNVQKDLKKDVINFTFRKLIDNFSRIKRVRIVKIAM